MGLTLGTLGIFICLAIVNAFFVPDRWRQWVLLLLSVIFVYSLQPPIFVRWLDFLFPTLTLCLVLVCWYVTRAEDHAIQHEDVRTLAVILMIIGMLSALRYVAIDYSWLLSGRPSPWFVVAGLVAGMLMFGVVLKRLPVAHVGLLVLIIGVFVVLKTEILATAVSANIRAVTGQDVIQAASIDLNWLGFSYIAFRLLHILRDRQLGILPALSLREMVTYVTFFPSLIAGPIDRAERFQTDLQADSDIDYAKSFTGGLTRIAVGVGKKFIIADTLAVGMSLDAVNAAQTDSVIGMWLLLYGYALRLYFDFSGYSDIAIGVGMLFGVTLPENFDRPYTKTSITAFWQSWHITLSDWVRTYVFSPFSRWLLKRRPKPPTILIVLSAQVVTMLVIGLWHGVTVNFFIWGLWHGIGLFVHKQWTNRTRGFYRGLKAYPARQGLADVCGWFLTFHFVVLSWVWFVIPDFALARAVFATLLGLG